MTLLAAGSGEPLFKKPMAGRACCARAAGDTLIAPSSPINSRRLVCRERSIVRGDGGRFMTPPPSRLEARGRLGEQAANELGAPVASSIPGQLPGREPASARKGPEDDRALLWRNRRVEGPPRRHGLAAGQELHGRQ